MKMQFTLFFVLVIVLIVGCKTSEYTNDNTTHTVALNILIANAENSLIEVLNRQGYVRNSQIINESTFFINYQRMEVEIELKNYQQLPLLQKELLRIPGVVSVSSLE